MKTKKEILLGILKQGDIFERLVMKGTTTKTKIVTQKTYKTNKDILYSECEKDIYIQIEHIRFKIDEFTDDLKVNNNLKNFILKENQGWKEILNKIDFFIKLNNKLPEKGIKDKVNKI